MHPLLFPFLSYSFLMIFTPGPSNVSASALGSKLGYRKSIAYMAGMSISFFLILLVSGLFADFLKANYSQFSTYLKWIGAAYIVWLVISLFIPTHQGQADKPTGIGLISGFLLVLLNPKGIGSSIESVHIIANPAHLAG